MSKKRRQPKSAQSSSSVAVHPARTKRVTIKDLAEHLGLSPATISRALNGSPQADALSPATRQRVEAAARELDYRPNYLARSLRGKRSFSVGVLVPEISEGYTAGLMSGIERLLRDDGYRYLMVSHHSQTRLLDEGLEMLLDRGVEGFLLVAVWLHRRLPVPTVVVSGPEHSDGADRVQIDHDRAAALALDHLIELGHRRIAFFRGASGNIDADDRWRAIREAAQARDLLIDPSLVVRLQGGPLGDPFTLDSGYAEGYTAGRDLVDRRQRFTALFAFNDISAIGATQAFDEAGLRVPADISIVGFDDIQSARYLRPALTTVRQPLHRMGETATRLLLDRLGNNPSGGPPESVVLKPTLVVRASTGPAPTGHDAPIRR